MKIAIDCREMLGSDGQIYGGVGRYIFNMAKHLRKILPTEDGLILFFPEKYRSIQILEEFKDNIVFLRSTQKKIPFISNHILVAREIEKQNADIVFFPANFIPLGFKGKSILAVHDLAIYRNPEWFPGGQFFSTKIGFPNSLRKSDKIIAVSQSTKQDLQDIFKLSKDKIEVVYEGTNFKKENLVTDIDGIGDYIFFVGTLSPRKNIIRTMKAFESLLNNDLIKEKYPSLELKIAGDSGWKSDAIFDYMRKSRFSGRIKYLGKISKHDKKSLIKNARLLSFVSLYEGFGLPILEAMSLGTPVVTSNISSMPEIAGEAALKADPEDIESIYRAFLEVLLNKNTAQVLRERGYAQCEKFTWENSAVSLLDILKSNF